MQIITSFFITNLHIYHLSKRNGDPPALHHNFMNIDDPVGTPTMSDKSTLFNMA